MRPVTILFVLYLLFAGQASAPELVAAALTASTATIYYRLVRRYARRQFYFAVPWGRLTWRVLVALVRDVGLVGLGLLRGVIGRPPFAGTARQPFQPGGFTPQAAGRRAVAVLAASIAPNGYVIEVLEPPNGLLMHRLMPTSPAPDRRFPV